MLLQPPANLFVTTTTVVKQTLVGYTLATWSADVEQAVSVCAHRLSECLTAHVCWTGLASLYLSHVIVMQFVTTVSSNLAKLYGRVSVSVLSVTSGSVVVKTATTLYTSNNAAAYKQLMSSSSTGSGTVYGSYKTTVDTSSITTSNGPVSPSTSTTTGMQQSNLARSYKDTLCCLAHAQQ